MLISGGIPKPENSETAADHDRIPEFYGVD